MIKLSDLKIDKEDKHDIWCYCPAHPDNNTPNFLVSKTGKYAGFGKCFACGLFTKVDMEGRRKIIKQSKPPAPINWVALNELYESNYITGVKPFTMWNVDKETLHQLHIGWSGEAHTFPMYNSTKTMIGIQRRFPDNQKKVIKGSRLGIFIPYYFSTKCSYIVVTEGISDTATSVDMGFNTLGRLSANCGEDIITDLLVKSGRKDITVIIIADKDEAGVEGANKLSYLLDKFTKCAIIVPRKGGDLREWVKEEGRKVVRQHIKNIIWSIQTMKDVIKK